MHVKTPELLAPAGDAQAFFAALEAGADSIYIGLKSFNARALAKNFTPQEAADLTAYAHQKGKKVFVAMNSLIKEAEIHEAAKALAMVEAIGADALIVQDLGLFWLAQRYFPGMRLHASTLMTIHNSFGVKQVHKMGFKRVVLAREMTMQEIEAAVKAAPIETEVFIHGAMCFCYSGLCLFSSFLGGRSSTRGKCVQPCRRKYKLGKGQGSYFSMNDLEAGPLVWDLAKIGVTSLKIEGRLRPANYVRHVVSGYRLLLDSAPGDQAALKEAREHFRQALGRPSSKGFFLTPSPADLISPKQTSNTGLFVGRIISVSKDFFDISAKNALLKKGDRIRLVNKRDEQQSFRIKKIHFFADKGQARIFHRLERTFQNALVFKTDCSKGGKTAKILNIGAASKKIKWDHAKVKHIVAELDKRPSPKGGRKGPSKPQLWLKLRNLHDIRWFSRAGIDQFLIKATWQNAVSYKKLHRNNKHKIVWYLEPVQHEEDAQKVCEVIALLMKYNAFSFEVSNLGHLEMVQYAFSSLGRRNRRKQPIKLYSSYQLNPLNSCALRLLFEQGIKAPQFSIETDLENMQRALHKLPDKFVSFTVFSFVPLFTSRMESSSLKPNAKVVSPKGEVTLWQRQKFGGQLISPLPYNALNQKNRLYESGLKALIIDLSHACRETGGIKEFARRFTNNRFLPRGRDFNLLKGLS